MTICKIDGCSLPASRREYCAKHYTRARRNNLLPGKNCSIPNCPNNAIARGWCRIHYQHWRENGDPLKAKNHSEYRCRVDGCQETYCTRGYCAKHYAEHKQVRLCSIPDCGQPAITRGWCRRHYERWKRHGDPHITKKRPNGAGTTCNGYMQYTNPDKGGSHFLFEHRLVIERQLGRPLTKEEVVHHRDGDGLNNDPVNLIAIDRVQHTYITHFVNSLRNMTPESLALAIEQAQAEGVFPFSP